MVTVGDEPMAAETSRNVALKIAYHGREFRGWADNPDVRTVEGVLRTALETVLRHVVTLHVAGRTDKGVHASGQVASLRTNAPHFDATLLQQSLNKLCRPDIAVTSVHVVDDDFHARFSARQRRYEYRLSDAEVADPLRADHVWFCRRSLDLELLRDAASAVPGERDFRSMCRRPPGTTAADPLIRRVDLCDWRAVGDELVLDIAANAFCHQMVRSLVGAMVDVAHRGAGAQDMAALLASSARSTTPAPPHGLNLVAVDYPTHFGLGG